MEEKIQKEVGDRNPSDVESLSVYGINCQEIQGLTADFENLQNLSIINVGLKSLKGFPKLSKLKRLELSDNKLSEGLEALEDCCELEELILVGNKVSDLSKLKPLTKLEKLTHLDLFGCPVTDVDDYRQSVFDLLPKLEYLDGTNKEGEDEEDDEDDDEPGLDYLTKAIGEEEDEEEDDYEPEDEEEGDEDYTISDEEEDPPPPKRTKPDDDNDEDEDDDDDNN